MSKEYPFKEIKDDGDWIVYENLEGFKDQFCNWLDCAVDEGFSEKSKVLSLKKDGRIYFHFRDIRLRNPNEEYPHDNLPPVQDLLIEIENVKRPNK